MVALCLTLIAAGCAVAAVATWLVRAVSLRAGALDAPGVRGQVKAATRRVPNTGGIGIVAGILLPLLAGLIVVSTSAGAAQTIEYFPSLAPFLEGIRAQTPAAAIMLGGILVLHIVGLIDDRRPLGPYLKLAVMLGTSAAVVMATDSRLLTLLDQHVGGSWLSIVITVLWLGVITNAFNFLDNMDGLAAGVGAVCALFFLVTAISLQQWFIAATLALLVGSLIGFLVFNFPRGPGGGASIFMGDGGSLVIGFLLSLMSVRITYIKPTDGSGPWYSVFVPLIILAVPLYDFISVTIIRVAQGRSPFVGDLQHFSHRLVGHGLSRRSAVLVIYGATFATGIGAILLPGLTPWQGALVGLQTLAIMLVIALYEWSHVPPDAERRGE